MEEVDIESVYQPTCINVNGNRWEKFGYVLITCSTVIMVLQGIGLGPAWVWERADDVTTVLFTFELLTRIFEKGYLFFTEHEKNWNFFDTFVVAISLFSMIIAAQAAQSSSTSAEGGGGGAMKQMKALRTLRLLRLLRLFRIFRGIEKANQFVDVVLDAATSMFFGIIVVIAIIALIATTAIACAAGAKAWLSA